ncbi:MAG: M15 family metallopeptidase [Tunicatimonas sp.]
MRHHFGLLLLLLTWYAALGQEPPKHSGSRLALDSVPTLQLSKDALLGKVRPARDSGFTLISRKYTSDTLAIYLREPTYRAFVRMARAAQADSINLIIRSATRSFAVQRWIWEAKWSGRRKVSGQNLKDTIPDPEQRALKILEYSSMPGTSRHHWGTDIDLNAFNNAYFATGQGKKVYDWLVAHAATYGFCQVYTEQNEDRPHGYHEEKWHWSYLPLAQQFLRQYNRQIGYADIDGFEGCSVAESVEAIERYVNGIAPQCQTTEVGPH